MIKPSRGDVEPAQDAADAACDSRVARGYDQLARWYERLERLRFGASLQRSRIALLDRLPMATHALFVGDGDGRLLQAFIAAQPNCQITSVDISQQMLQIQKERLRDTAGSSRRQFIHADIQELNLPDQYDLVVTAFHLDCFTEKRLTFVINRLIQRMVPGGSWYVVDFQLPKSGWQRQWAKFWAGSMVSFFRWRTNLQTTTLIDPRPILRHEGLQTVCDHQSWNRFTFSTLLRKT